MLHTSLLSCLVVLAIGLVSPTVGVASSVTVLPGASIQQALDSTADTVFVHAGLFKERLVIGRDVVLLPWRGTPPLWLDAVPEVDAITVGPPPESQAGTVMIAGFTIHGALRLPNSSSRDWDELTVEGCRADSGITHMASASSVFHARIRGCTFFGDVAVNAWYVDFHHNTVIGGETALWGEGEQTIHSNVFLDSPGTALRTVSGGNYLIRSNYIRRALVGVLVGPMARVERNVVLDCLDAGFRGGAHYRENRIEHCGVGIDVDGDRHAFAQIMDCTILQCGTGLRITEAYSTNLTRNRVGRCSGAGIVADGGWIEGNTVFRNGGSDIVLGGGDLIARNVSFENGGYGLEAPTSSQSVLDCNDWYGNANGSTIGVIPDISDLAVDPRFCDVDSNDVHLRPDSPLLSEGNCGLIGADSVGCGAATRTRDVGPPPITEGGAKELLLMSSPNPGRGSSRIGFTLPGEAHAVLSVIDVQGRVVARLAEGRQSAGEHEVEWRSVEPGTYFVRLQVGARTLSRKLSILR